MAIIARPKFSVGDTLSYGDRHSRITVGKVKSIVATWAAWQASGSAPYLIYKMGHPTYSGGFCYCNESDICAGQKP